MARAATTADAFNAVAEPRRRQILDALWAMYQWLDRAPKGRNETGPWFRRHDEYEGSG